MIRDTYKKIESETSGYIALGHVAEISKYHRIQASPGIRAACNYSIESFKKYGINAKMHSYPANGRDYDWTSLRFKEWSCKDAWLKIIEPEEKYIARYEEEKIHVIQRSISTDGIIEAEVVAPLNKGEEQKDYDRTDVKDKFVLTNGDVHRVYQLAVVEHGARGIIFDGMFVRPPNLLEGELDDSLKYTSFWWNPGVQPGFGWVVTPRTGKELRALIDAKKIVKSIGFIDAQLYDGYLNNVVATIPGKTDEEVIIIAHICHPQPSANDNASGAGAAIEVARVLNKLINIGELPKPKRSIRITLVPEMTGTYSYLVEREDDIDKIIGAINLDMVGEDQGKTGSILVIHKTSDSLPSYVNAIVEAIFEEAQKEVAVFGSKPSHASFRHTVEKFSSGSDHYIYSDPSVGIPCPMIIQWPDKFYHTSADSVDKVSPHSLRKVVSIAASYIYFLANAGELEAPWIASQVINRIKGNIVKLIQETIDCVVNLGIDPTLIVKQKYLLRQKLEYETEIASRAIFSIKRISPKFNESMELLTKELENFIKKEYNHFVKIVEDYVTKQGIIELPTYIHEEKTESNEATKIPSKLYRGPLSSRPWIARLSKQDQEGFRVMNKRHGVTHGGPATLALYWTDGTRNISEISKLVELESGSTNIDYLIEYYGYLEKMGLVKFQNR
jgi:aminopeptidase-like protein